MAAVYVWAGQVCVGQVVAGQVGAGLVCAGGRMLCRCVCVSQVCVCVFRSGVCVLTPVSYHPQESEYLQPGEPIRTDQEHSKPWQPGERLLP